MPGATSSFLLVLYTSTSSALVTSSDALAASFTVATTNHTGQIVVGAVKGVVHMRIAYRNMGQEGLYKNYAISVCFVV